VPAVTAPADTRRAPRGQEEIMKKVLLVVCAVTLLAAPAVAGITDPSPPLSGSATKVAYSTTGVISGGGLETVFHCTSASTTLMSLGVQVYFENGTSANDITGGNGRFDDLGPGETRTLVTGPVVGISNNTSVIPAAFVRNGSARIITTDTRLICSAWVVDAANSPPNSMVQLNMVAKTKQKGD
jgi:hypothetical protein